MSRAPEVPFHHVVLVVYHEGLEEKVRGIAASVVGLLVAPPDHARAVVHVPDRAVADEVHQRGHQAWGWLRAHPEAPRAAGAALLILRPRRVLRLCWRWGRRAWFAKRLYDRWRQALHKL